MAAKVEFLDSSSSLGGTKATGALPRDSDFYNREREQESLNRKFNTKPGVITVVVGPPDCGKTVRSALAVFARAAGTSFPIGFTTLIPCPILTFTRQLFIAETAGKSGFFTAWGERASLPLHRLPRGEDNIARGYF